MYKVGIIVLHNTTVFELELTIRHDEEQRELMIQKQDMNNAR